MEAVRALSRELQSQKSLCESVDPEHFNDQRRNRI